MPTPSIDKIKASNGSGNANLATVQSTRSSGATTIVVDTVLNINTNFMASMGTPHTFTDPVTSETITVISEATAVDFAGHVSGANLIIDTIAPGYTDAGSAVGDIVIIRPTTQWADNVASTLAVSLNDAGTLKTTAVDTASTLKTTGWIAVTDAWTYASGATTNVGTITVPTDATTTYQAGDKLQFTQSTVKYAIITKVTATVLTVYMGTDYTIANAAISAISISRVKNPFGFNTDPIKWTVRYTYTDNNSTTSATYAQVGAHQITIPIGSWRVYMYAKMQATLGGNNTGQGFVALSTATNSASDVDLITSGANPAIASLGGISIFIAASAKHITLSSATIYYQIFSRTTALTWQVVGSDSAGIIEAVSAYL